MESVSEHRHFYLKTGLMGGWHPVEQKHPLDASAHDHGDIESRDAKLTRTSTVRMTETDRLIADQTVMAEIEAAAARVFAARDEANALAIKGFSSIEDALANAPVLVASNGRSARG
jgi:hypothetical protein